MKEQIRAWIYCRIDAPEDVHGTLKDQKKELYDYADQMGFSVVGCSVDIGSSMDQNRSGLIKVTKAASQKEMDILLIKKMSCLGRNAEQTLEIFQELEQSDVRLCSPLEGEISLEQNMSFFFY